VLDRFPARINLKYPFHLKANGNRVFETAENGRHRRKPKSVAKVVTLNQAIASKCAGRDHARLTYVRYVRSRRAGDTRGARVI